MRRPCEEPTSPAVLYLIKQQLLSLKDAEKFSVRSSAVVLPIEEMMEQRPAPCRCVLHIGVMCQEYPGKVGLPEDDGNLERRPNV